MLSCVDLVEAALADEAGGWHCEPIGDDLLHVVAPRYYSDGDAVEIDVRVRDAEVLVTDAGGAITRLEMFGLDMQSTRLRDAWSTVLRSYHIADEHGRLLMKGPLSAAGRIINEMLDALLSVDGLRALAPTSLRRPPFSESLIVFLEAEFPNVEPKPTLSSTSGRSYKLTAAVHLPRRRVYLQAVSTNDRTRQVEHAFTTLADIDGQIHPDAKLVVLEGDGSAWPEPVQKLLSSVAFLSAWDARDRFIRFIHGDIPRERMMLAPAAQLTLS